MVELRQLRHVIALAEHRNYARASGALHITQPALTRSIQGIEAQLGAPLFDRGPREVTPTAIGELVLRHARAIEHAAHDLERDVGLAKGMDLGELRVGAGPFVGATLVGEVVARMSRTHPKLRSCVTVAPWRELPERVRRREIELMVADMSEVEASEDFEVMPLEHHPTVAVGRAGHPLAVHPSPLPQTLLDYPLAGAPASPKVEDELARLLRPGARRQGAPGSVLAITCDSFSVLKSVLLHSDAIAMLSPFMCADEFRDGRLVAMPRIQIDLHAKYGIARLRGRTLSEPARVFCDTLLAWDAELADTEQAMLKALRR